MPWFKVDDALALHMKAITAGNTALGLWVRAGSWSMHQLSDGFIPEPVVSALGGRSGDAVALMNAGLWDSADGGYQFHDWAEYQPTREQVLAEREAAAQRMRRVRANVQPNEQRTNGDRSDSPSRPVPSPDLTKTSLRQSRTKDANETTDSDPNPTLHRLAARQGITSIPAVVAAIEKHTSRTVTPEQAFRVGLWILEKRTGTPPRAPQRYVTGAIARSPFEVQQHIDEGGAA